MMYKIKFLVFAMASLLLSNTCLAQVSSPDEQAIWRVIQTAYLDGVFNKGDTAAVRQGFHEDFRLIGQLPEGKMRLVSRADWEAAVLKKQVEGKYPLPPGEQVSGQLLQIDITGAAAAAKMAFYVGGKLSYIDYLHLYRFGQNWKIIHKIYHQQLE
ncbi:MAG: nuclear transport factor 2 family protein [Microscillaceae bacterium]|nr:nuclear transport factor 2 family protein [Microscillaceae bacterium]